MFVISQLHDQFKDILYEKYGETKIESSYIAIYSILNEVRDNYFTEENLSNDQNNDEKRIYFIYNSKKSIFAEKDEYWFKLSNEVRKLFSKDDTYFNKKKKSYSNIDSLRIRYLIIKNKSEQASSLLKTEYILRNKKKTI